MTSLAHDPLKREGGTSVTSPIFGKWASPEFADRRKLRHLDVILGEGSMPPNSRKGTSHKRPSPPKTAPAGPPPPPLGGAPEFTTFVSPKIHGVEGANKGDEYGSTVRMAGDFHTHKRERSRLFTTQSESEHRILPGIMRTPEHPRHKLPPAERHASGAYTHDPNRTTNSNGIPLNPSPVKRPTPPPPLPEDSDEQRERISREAEHSARRHLTWGQEPPTWRSFSYGMNLSDIQARAAGLAEPVESSVYQWMIERPNEPDGSCSSKGRMIKRLWEGHTRVIASSIARMRVEMDQIDRRSLQAEPLQRELEKQHDRYGDLQYKHLQLEGELDHSRDELEKRNLEMAAFIRERDRLMDIADKYEAARVARAKVVVQLENRDNELAKLHMQLQNMRLKEEEWGTMQTALESELSKALDKAEGAEIAFMELMAAREAGEAYLFPPGSPGDHPEEEEVAEVPEADVEAMGSDELKGLVKGLQQEVSALRAKLKTERGRGGRGNMMLRGGTSGSVGEGGDLPLSSPMRQRSALL
eukprot:CAMPEP_0182886254 /NCGR_PEP_ID=MMETSP0034_2-20130328/20098_1 /TAXON_ID=156128 /ORGANISM="Nephroselmis pyriformis, Strain CCMP717" /LENGTH=527 /DNA_ID=CAMNT_0025019565 /DNA_START=330 /DNA_END=1909 /DNA_ORIENTATION=+